MSIYKRDGSPYYWYEFQYKARRFRGSTGKASRREAERFEVAEKARVKENFAEIALGLSKPTVDEVFARYWSAYGHKLSWAGAVQDHMKGAIEVWGGSRPFEELTTADYAAALEQYAATGVTDSTVNRRLSVLRKIHNVAQDVWELPVEHIKWKTLKRAEPRERVRFLTPEQAKPLIQILPEHIRLMALWTLATGCRLNETETLTWERVYIGPKRAEVLTKGGGTRFVELNGDALAVLGECHVRSETRLVFNNRNRRKIWERALREAGVSDFRWHDLRHTYATWLGQRGAGLHVIQKALGHSQITTTMRYTHAVSSDVEEANKRLPRMHDAKSSQNPPQKVPTALNSKTKKSA